MCNCEGCNDISSFSYCKCKHYADDYKVFLNCSCDICSDSIESVDNRLVKCPCNLCDMHNTNGVHNNIECDEVPNVKAGVELVDQTDTKKELNLHVNVYNCKDEHMGEKTK